MLDPACATGQSGMGLLAALQHADTFFPSGSMAFSWGLEGLLRDRLVTNATTLEAFVESQALTRWATFDQGIVCASWDAFEARGAWREADAYAEAMTLPLSLRTGSLRLGRTLSDVHARLGSPTASELRQDIANGLSPGHLAAVQGVLWRSFGIGKFEARAMSAHTTCTGAVSAAVRLGIVGHLDAQRILSRLRQPIADVLDRPPPSLSDLSSATYAADIASLRGEAVDARMFAN
jgi:urease accessory protein